MRLELVNATGKKTLRDAPFININLAVAAHVEHARSARLMVFGPYQKLQVRLAAILEELYDFLRTAQV